MQYIYRDFFFSAVKTEKFQLINFDIFNNLAQNNDCAYRLEPSHQCGSNEYPQSIFWIKNKNNRNTPANSSFPVLLYKSGIQGGIHVMDMFS